MGVRYVTYIIEAMIFVSAANLQPDEVWFALHTVLQLTWVELVGGISCHFVSAAQRLLCTGAAQFAREYSVRLMMDSQW